MNPPPVADARANAILDHAGGGAVPDARTRVGRASQRLRASQDLLDRGLVTIAEHGDQVIYAATETINAAGIPALPPGAPPHIVALYAAIVGLNNNMNARFNNIDARFNNIDARFNNIDARFNNIDARLANAAVTEGGDMIHALTNAAGHPPPPVFPGTYAELLRLNDNAAGTLLLHYGLPADPQATRNVRLRKFLGLRV